MHTTLKKAHARRAAAMQRLRERGGFRSLMSAEGAIDLMSIMVGAIVMLVLAGIIGASVFVVIPWAQDNAAEQALDAVKTAEATAYAMSSTDGQQKYYTFEGSDVPPADPVHGSIKLQENDKVTIKVSTNKQKYAAVSVSETGKAYLLKSDSSEIDEFASATAANTAATSFLTP